MAHRKKYYVNIMTANVSVGHVVVAHSLSEAKELANELVSNQKWADAVEKIEVTRW